MNGDIERLFELPYEKATCVEWLTKHLEFGLDEPNDGDKRWLKGLASGNSPEPCDLIAFNLTPSIWYAELQRHKNWTLLGCFDWLEKSYDTVLQNAWDGWVLDTVGELLNEPDLCSEFRTYLEALEQSHLNEVAKMIGFPSVYVKNLPTRKLTLGLESKDFSTIPDSFTPTETVDAAFLESIL